MSCGGRGCQPRPTRFVALALSPVGSPTVVAMPTVSTVLPSKECEGQVTVEAFGAPPTGPSAWSLPITTSLVIESPTPEAELIRVWPAADGPECVGQSDAIDAASGMPARSWMDRVRLVEFVAAPVGTKVILWAECSDPAAGTGIDNTQGWFLTVD